MGSHYNINFAFLKGSKQLIAPLCPQVAGKKSSSDTQWGQKPGCSFCMLTGKNFSWCHKGTLSLPAYNAQADKKRNKCFS